MINDIIAGMAASHVKELKTDWETGLAFVTDKVAFNMREIIKQCRKNYFGIFDLPYDKVTGREKVWHHLTKMMVDYKVKNQDMDTKDINYRAKHPKAKGLASVVRAVMRTAFDEVMLGEDIDITQRQLEIDGTTVWCNDMDSVKPRLVNLLNFYINPTAKSIAETEGIIERIILPLNEFKKIAKKDKWVNLDVKGSQSVSDTDTVSTQKKATKMVELFRYRGMGSEFLMTGREEDMDKETSLEIVCSVTDGEYKTHSISRRKDNKLKGYEEAWSTRVAYRWYGEGTAERLLQYQLVYNENLNNRLERGRVAKLGIFQYREGSGITGQMISKLPVNGAIKVKQINTDIANIPVSDVPVSAYKDEELLYLFAQRVTGNFEAGIGETLPASTPATNAALQSQAAKTQYVLGQEGFGMFLQRWVKNIAMPIAFSKVKIGQMVRMELDPADLRAFDAQQVDKQLLPMLEQMNQNMFDTESALMERERAIQQAQAQGDSRFVNIDVIPDITKYDVQVYTTNEEMDKNVATQNLISLLPAAPEYRDQMVEQIFDLMGLTFNRPRQFMPQMQQMQSNQAMGQEQPMQPPSQNPTQAVTNAFV